MTKHDPANFDDSAPLVEPDDTDEDAGAPKFFNDAEILGKETPAFEEALGKDVTFLTGELWGARDRRNTQDEKWQPVTMPLVRWIAGAAGTANTPTFGLSRHPEVKHKEGTSFVLGSSIAGARKAKAMDTMFAMGLDIDSGAKLDDMLDKVEAMGLFCIAYTSHSHGKSGLQLKHEEVIKKLKIKPSELNLAQVQRYLREHSKERYEEDFILKVEIVEEKKQVKSGVVIDLKTPPLDKFRLIFPLAEPVKLVELADTQSAALDVWENKITGLATEMLGVHFDTSCTDPSRLFFLPRHPKGAKEWYSAIIQGDPLRFEDVPEVKKSVYANLRRPLNPFEQAGGVQDNGDMPPRCVTPSGASLNDWHSKAKDRFQMADLVEDQCADRIRVSGGEAQGHVHIECPFEHEHSEEGGTATMVINALDNHENGYWTWFCHHDSCQGKHKLEFVQEALAQGWFSEDELFGDSVYMMEGADEDEEDEEAREHRLVVEARALVPGQKNVEKKTRELIRGALADKESMALKEQLRTIVCDAKPRIFDRPTFNRMWKEEDKNRTAEDRASRRGGGFESVDLEAPFRDRCDRIYKLMTRQSGSPTIFQHNGVLVDVQTNEHGNPRMVEIKKDRFKALVEGQIDFLGNDSTEGARFEDINNVFHRDRCAYPPLHRVIASPVFGPDKTLICEAGYHPASGLFYSPREGVEIPHVPEAPADCDVAHALNELMDILADFPFDGFTSRRELIAAVGAGRDVPSFCHALSAALTPICRAFIHGPTPGHLARKDKPRTGATKLLSAVSQIAMLDNMARPQSLPSDKSEVQKTVISALDSGQPYIFFDNLPDSGKVDFGELAGGMTAYPYYTGRRLGQSALVECLMNATWLFTGNRTQLSAELAARMLLINLDPKMERPEEREGFKYQLDEHIPASAGRYLHALLVLVQNWIAQGLPMWTGKPLGGFEAHSKTIGGILEAAGINGFLTNHSVMQEVGRVDTPEDMMMDALIAQLYSPEASHKPGVLFRVWGQENPPQTRKTDAGTEPSEWRGFHVVSIRDMLQDAGIAIPGTGYTREAEGEVFYPMAAKPLLAGKIGSLAGAVREWGPDREEDEARQGRYVLQRASADKHGTFYTLEKLDLGKGR